MITEVELIFTPDGEGTKVSLEHRYLERLGASADDSVNSIRGGWAERLGDFQLFANRAARA